MLVLWQLHFLNRKMALRLNSRCVMKCSSPTSLLTASLRPITWLIGSSHIIFSQNFEILRVCPSLELFVSLMLVLMAMSFSRHLWASTSKISIKSRATPGRAMACLTCQRASRQGPQSKAWSKLRKLKRWKHLDSELASGHY